MRRFSTLPAALPRQVRLVLAQFNGTLDGYNANRGNLPEMTLQDLLLLNLAVDMGDIVRHVEPAKVWLRRTTSGRAHRDCIVVVAPFSTTC